VFIAYKTGKKKTYIYMKNTVKKIKKCQNIRGEVILLKNKNVKMLGEKLCKWLGSSVGKTAKWYFEGPRFEFQLGWTFFLTL
jgi:hypothetical protein